MPAPDLVLATDSTLKEALQQMSTDLSGRQRWLPAADGNGALAGALTRHGLQEKLKETQAEGKVVHLRELTRTEAVVAFSDDPLRVVVNRNGQRRCEADARGGSRKR
jgi:hypothetical protein